MDLAGDTDLDGGRDVTKLREELRIARAALEQLRAAAEGKDVTCFAEILSREKHRSERYNHYFSVLLLASGKLSAAEILRRTGSSLRASDMVGILDGDGRHPVPGHSRTSSGPADSAGSERGGRTVGVILPETDRKGAQTAVQRLSGICATEEGVRIGMAVFPDDSTQAEELLAIAAPLGAVKE